MVTGIHTVFSCATNFLNGRKCIFCGSFKTTKTARSEVGLDESCFGGARKGLRGRGARGKSIIFWLLESTALKDF